jgi:hypothetical protein
VVAGRPASRIFLDAQWNTAVVDSRHGVGPASSTDAGWRVAITRVVAEVGREVR